MDKGNTGRRKKKEKRGRFRDLKNSSSLYSFSLPSFLSRTKLNIGIQYLQTVFHGLASNLKHTYQNR